MKILVLHTETTGLNNEVTKPINLGHDIVSIGMLICDEKFNILNEKLIFIKNNKESIGTEYHNISKDFLNKNGITEEEAIVDIANFIIENFEDTKNIKVLGQNVSNFSLLFLKDLLYKYELYFDFSINTLDTYSLLFPTMGHTTVRGMVETFKVDKNFDKEEIALKKCYLYLKVFETMRALWKKL